MVAVHNDPNFPVVCNVAKYNNRNCLLREDKNQKLIINSTSFAQQQVLQSTALLGWKKDINRGGINVDLLFIINPSLMTKEMSYLQESLLAF